MIAPDLDAIAVLAEAARAALPDAFRAAAADVRLVVEDWPSDAILDEMEIDDAYDLSGLYDGVALTERSVDHPEPPSTITLFRRPILDEWAARGNVTLEELVIHVTIHEFAHHFGWSDDDVATIDRWWE
ncbi:MAG: metallopeptidase family protein [Pseudomonadota bacterium]